MVVAGRLPEVSAERAASGHPQLAVPAVLGRAELEAQQQVLAASAEQGRLLQPQCLHRVWRAG